MQLLTLVLRTYALLFHFTAQDRLVTDHPDHLIYHSLRLHRQTQHQCQKENISLHKS